MLENQQQETEKNVEVTTELEGENVYERYIDWKKWYIILML